ncbi:MAG: protein kinase [Pseudomonadota bacterium]
MTAEPLESNWDIPGYQAPRSLRTEASPKIYLARHLPSMQDRVIKIVSATEYVAYQVFLAASPNHPNLLNILELGETPSARFVALPYCERGDLADQLYGGMHIQALAKTIKDVTRALQSMHEAGLVHCDVKPTNVLFATDGSVLLSDFGNCRKVGQSCKNAAGLVSGTAAYMSPEQAAGRDIDPRADFYSLGVMLYHALVGKLPFSADTPIELGIKHLQDPIPRLPGHLSCFQQVLDGLLSKRRDQRLDDVTEIVGLIDSARSQLESFQTSIKTQEISTQEIRIAGGDVLATPRDPARAERLDRRRKRRRVARVSGIGVLAIAAIAGGTFYSVQEGLINPEVVLSQIGIGEDPTLQLAWGEAQSIHADPNQGLASIVAAYRRVLAIEPGHLGATTAVSSLNAEWLQAIDTALGEGNIEGATTRLQEARSVFPDSVSWVQIDTRIQNYQRAERILESTRSLLASHGLSDLPSATAAIQSYQEVLRLAPGHTEAQSALAELASHYANLAKTSASNGQVNDAISLLERATAADSTLPVLDEVRTLISQATTAQQAIDELLQQARRFRANNQLIAPAGENAAELYHRVLATDTNNVIARQGLDELRAQITANVENLLSQKELLGVESVLVQAANAGMNSDFINEIRGRLDAAVARAQTIETQLAQAIDLISQGFLTAPPDNNAVAKLRTVQQLDPGNEIASRQLAEIAQRLADVANDAHTWKMYEEAKQYLDLALTITPEVAEWETLRDSWEEGVSDDASTGAP